MTLSDEFCFTVQREYQFYVEFYKFRNCSEMARLILFCLVTNFDSIALG